MKTFLSCLKILTILFVILFFLFAIAQRLNGAHHPKFFGYACAVVVSGSMEPDLPKGSFVILEEQGEYKEGDIVTYNHEDGISVTHRVVSVDGNTVRTRGDANRTEDTPFGTENIVGKVVYRFSAMWVFIPMALFAIYGIFRAIKQ